MSRTTRLTIRIVPRHPTVNKIIKFSGTIYNPATSHDTVIVFVFQGSVCAAKREADAVEATVTPVGPRNARYHVTLGKEGVGLFSAYAMDESAAARSSCLAYTVTG